MRLSAHLILTDRFCFALRKQKSKPAHKVLASQSDRHVVHLQRAKALNHHRKFAVREFVGLDRADGSKVQQFLPRKRKQSSWSMFQGPENGKAYACGQSAGVSRAAHLQCDAAIVVVIQHENGAEVAHVDRPVLQRLQLPNFCRQNTIQRDSDCKCATKNARKHGENSKPIREPARWSRPRAHTWPRAAPASNRKSRSFGHNRSNSEAQCRRTPSDSPVWTEPLAPIRWDGPCSVRLPFQIWLPTKTTLTLLKGGMEKLHAGWGRETGAVASDNEARIVPSGEGSSVMMRMLNTPELDALEKDLLQRVRRSKPARGARRKLLQPGPAPETSCAPSLQMREGNDASHAEAPELRTSTANLSLQANYARAAAHVPKLRLSAMGEPSVVRVDALQLQCEDVQSVLSARSQTIENIRSKVAQLKSPPSAINVDLMGWLRAAHDVIPPPGDFSVAGVAEAEPLRPTLQNEGEITGDLMFPTGSPAVISRDALDCQIEDLHCATEALEKARKYSTGEAQALVQLGEVYEYMGLYPEAREYYLECTQDSSLLLNGDINVSTYIQRARFRLGMLAFKDGNLQIAIGEVEACFSAYLASSCIEGLCRSQIVLAYLHVLWEACGLFPLMDRLQIKGREEVLPACVGDKHGKGITVAEDLINDYVYLTKCQLESSALASADAREDQTRMQSAVEKMSELRVNMELKVHEIHVRFVEDGGSVAEDVQCEKEEARKRVRDIVDTHTETLLKVLNEYRAALKAGRFNLISPEASEGLEDL